MSGQPLRAVAATHWAGGGTPSQRGRIRWLIGVECRPATGEQEGLGWGVGWPIEVPAGEGGTSNR